MGEVRRPQTQEELLDDLVRLERELLAGFPGEKVRELARINLPHRVHVDHRPRVGHIRPLRPVRVLIDNRPGRRTLDEMMNDVELRTFIDNL